MLTESEVKHWHVTYNNIHNLIHKNTPKIATEFNPDLLVAIGFFPARVMQTFLRGITTNKTLQIQAISLFLYEPVDGVTEDKISEQVIRTQWFYALTELCKDVEAKLLNHPEEDRDALRTSTKFSISVIHNKNKPKLAELPEGTLYYIIHNTICRYLWLSNIIQN
ncbi:hypothetical protein F5877DRAFT_93525 [Lentinula edodes]|nr:hypothetical protein F5877DRAFT_93525 [Lentinula edodes]